MKQHGNFLGELEINGRVEHLMLYVFLAGEDLSICDIQFPKTLERHRRFGFSPFTRGMLVTHAADELAHGRFFELSGTRVGSIRDGRSAAYGEGEWDRRIVRALRLDLAYFMRGISVTMRGETLPGTKVRDPGPACETVLPPWQFRLQFDIPRDAFRDLFDLNDLGEQTLNEVFERYASDA